MSDKGTRTVVRAIEPARCQTQGADSEPIPKIPNGHTIDSLGGKGGVPSPL